jgi:hypothetical protein
VLVAAVLAAAVAGGAAGCTATTGGQARVDPAADTATSDVPTTGAPSSGAASSSARVPTPASTSAAPSGGLPIVDAGLADDCLLTGAQMGTLAGVGPMSAEQTSVTQSDGQKVDSCFYTEQGSFQPKGRVQVYTAAGVPVASVMDQLRGTEVPGVGDRAVLVRGDTQNLLWIAAGTRIATVRLSGGLDGTPERFRAAGAQAVAALATR